MSFHDYRQQQVRMRHNGPQFPGTHRPSGPRPPLSPPPRRPPPPSDGNYRPHPGVYHGQHHNRGNVRPQGYHGQRKYREYAPERQHDGQHKYREHAPPPGHHVQRQPRQRIPNQGHGQNWQNAPPYGQFDRQHSRNAPPPDTPNIQYRYNRGYGRPARHRGQYTGDYGRHQGWNNPGRSNPNANTFNTPPAVPTGGLKQENHDPGYEDCQQPSTYYEGYQSRRHSGSWSYYSSVEYFSDNRSYNSRRNTIDYDGPNRYRAEHSESDGRHQNEPQLSSVHRERGDIDYRPGQFSQERWYGAPRETPWCSPPPVERRVFASQATNQHRGHEWQGDVTRSTSRVPDRYDTSGTSTDRRHIQLQPNAFHPPRHSNVSRHKENSSSRYSDREERQEPSREHNAQSNNPTDDFFLTIPVKEEPIDNYNYTGYSDTGNRQGSQEQPLVSTEQADSRTTPMQDVDSFFGPLTPDRPPNGSTECMQALNLSMAPARERQPQETRTDAESSRDKGHRPQYSPHTPDYPPPDSANTESDSTWKQLSNSSNAPNKAKPADRNIFDDLSVDHRDKTSRNRQSREREKATGSLRIPTPSPPRTPRQSFPLQNTQNSRRQTPTRSKLPKYAKFMCRHCKTSFRTKEAVDHHGQLVNCEPALHEEEMDISQLIASAPADRTQDDVGSNICETCGRVFEEFILLTEHQQEHEEFSRRSGSAKPLFCISCLVYFKSSRESSFHMREFHKESTDTRATIEDRRVTKPELFISPKNNAASSNREVNISSVSRNAIKDLNKDGSTNECKTCGLKLSSVLFLERHKLTHNPKDAKTGLTKPFKCFNCPSYFEEEAALQSHLDIFHSEVLNNKHVAAIRGDTAVNVDASRSNRVTLKTSNVSSKKRKREGTVITCDICGRSFLSEAHFKSHEGIHQERSAGTGRLRPFKCTICRSFFFARKSLANHVSSCHLGSSNAQACDVQMTGIIGKPTQIPQTSVSTDSASIDESKPAVKAVPCDICGRLFSTAFFLRRHQQSHERIVKKSGKCKNFECKACKLYFADNGKLKKHRIQFHKDSAGAPNARNIETDPSLICNFCQKVFTNKGNLKMHLGTHMPKSEKIEAKMLYKCKNCSVTFDKEYGYYQHMIDRHSTVNEHLGISGLFPPEISYACFVCNQEYPNKSAVYLHSQQHEEFDRLTGCKKAYKCRECANSYFNDYSVLCKHSKKMHNKAPEGGKVGAANGTVGAPIHLEKYDDVKPGPSCKKPKLDPGLDSQSTSVKYDGKPVETFSCGICGQKFNQKAGVGKHMKVHSNNADKKNKYPCTLCSAVYSAIDKYKRHLENAHNYGQESKIINNTGSTASNSSIDSEVEDFKPEKRARVSNKQAVCSICGQTCKTAQGLAKHTRVHTARENKLPKFPCAVCKAEYYSRTKLMKHMDNVHPNGDRKPPTAKRRIDEGASTSVGTDHQPLHGCNHCGQTFIGKAGLKKHLVVHTERPHQKSKFKCSVCNAGYYKLQHLKHHLQKAHQTNAEISNPRRDRHSEMHEASKRKHAISTLDLNSNETVTPTADTSNRKKTVKTKTCHCDNCGKQFQDRRGLTSHARSCQKMQANKKSEIVIASPTERQDDTPCANYTAAAEDGSNRNYKEHESRVESEAPADSIPPDESAQIAEAEAEGNDSAVAGPSNVGGQEEQDRFEKYRCKICEQYIRISSKKHHEESHSPLVAGQQTRKAFTCRFCKTFHINSSAYYNHMWSVHKVIIRTKMCVRGKDGLLSWWH